MASRARVRVRRAPHLVLYWQGGAMRLHNYATGHIVVATAEICATLDFCDTWRSVGAIASHLAVDRALALRLVDTLVEHGALQRSDAAVDPRHRRMQALDSWNPAAGLFHDVTRRVRFLGPAAAARFMRERATHAPMPPVVKRMRGAPVVHLPAPEAAGEFPQVLLARRTWRRFGSAPVTVQQLSTSVGLAAGVQRWVTTPLGRLPLKTSPSGGARHPIEAYLCVRNVAGLPAGLYHYAADRHLLERVRRGDLTPRLGAWMPHSGYFAKAAFLVVLTAVLDREVWRYPYARAYRAALAEAGHVCQTFCLAATWQGLAPFCLMGTNDERIEQDLGIDGVRETVLYVAGAGARPRGSLWSPRVRGRLRSEPNRVLDS